ncbi:GNAT family N-acetyltransferase [Streptomyces sp. SCA3-4]|uniref:GNAT family N-acetyltransferase n=1 Tax=Streptomyces sichuanensis TaxID=2871810 RepID=UPI001CE28252|nr:GNAT family N-acetyltransferase [Streptomyces sichuanensis]MCA6094866.1 GNAT family N-acetyltransferase [Streptomyces sichuanensis]
MDVRLRPGTPEDAEACGRICYEAFRHITAQHAFPVDFPDAETATGAVSMMLSHPGFYSVVAEQDGRVVASNFLDERSQIAGVGPITVDPGLQERGVGRALMLDVMRRAEDRGFPGVRLLQAGYNTGSLSLYAKLGFEVRDVLACMQGTPPGGEIPGHRVRPATGEDADACNTLCRRVHGHDRAGELADAIGQGTALVAEHAGRISGYATDLAFFAHAVGEGNEDVKALIAAARAFAGTGILVPMMNADLFRWCLEQGLRVQATFTLMTTGLHGPPQGAYLPSILY